jgi:hypothetical protein
VLALLLGLVIVSAGCLGATGPDGPTATETATPAGQSAPTTTIEASQETVFYQDRDYESWCGDPPANAEDGESNPGGACFNGTEVLLTHAGGDTLSPADTEILVAGNASVWGTVNPASEPEGGGYSADTGFDPDTDEHLVRPVPDFVANDPFESGDTWRVSAYGGPIEDQKGWHNRVWPDREVVGGDYWVSFKADQNREDLWAIRHREGDSMVPPKVNANTLASGDEIKVVWTASSGDESETLFEYAVA